MEEHYYNPDHRHLLDLGYKPTHDMESEIETMLTDLMPFKERILARKEAIMPKIGFNGKIRKFNFISKKSLKVQIESPDIEIKKYGALCSLLYTTYLT